MKLLRHILPYLLFIQLLSAQTASRESLYLTMSDSTRIAVDLFLPAIGSGETIPVVIRATRYWRAWDILAPALVADVSAIEAEIWNNAGYAIILVDARGSGASFGNRQAPWSQPEVADYGEIVDWAVAQSWCNGRVGTHGVSYDGNTAEFFSTQGRNAVKIVAPMYSDFDPYGAVAMPGGLKNSIFTAAWSEYNGFLDANDICAVVGADSAICPTVREFFVTGVRPVDADTGYAMLEAAVLEHQANVDVFNALEPVVYRDDLFNGLDMTTFSPYGYKQEIEQSDVVFYAQAGWLDAGTADGALTRFNTFSNSQHVVIGPWGHGPEIAVDPFQPDLADSIDFISLIQLVAAEFAPWLQNESPPGGGRNITYYTLNGGGWKTSTTWPPAGVEMQSLFLADNHTLSEDQPLANSGSDDYVVDFTATNGPGGRWLQDNDKHFPDRSSADQLLLTYTSEPLSEDTEITGHPEIRLFVKSTESDGAFIVYLEDVAPDGRVTYITEGVFRALHRKISNEQPPFHIFGPYHSYKQADGALIPPNETVELHFTMQPTSVLLKAGHRIRIAIAGHDADTFERVPETGNPVITVQHNSLSPSAVILPVMTGSQTGIATNGPQLPAAFELMANYPNPFNPSTTIRFRLDKAAKVTLNIYDASGRLVSELLNGTTAAGTHSLHFDASGLTSGVYFYRLQVEGKSQTRKMLLLR